MTQIKTAMLVRCRAGYVEVFDPGIAAQYGRRETLFSTDLPSIAEASVYANNCLGWASDPAPRVRLDIEPDLATPATRPLFGFGLGDTITVPSIDLQTTVDLPVSALTVAQDSNGVMSWAPDTGLLQQSRELNQARILRRMLGGTLQGSVDGFAPTHFDAPVARKHDTALQPATFSMAGVLTSTESPRWTIIRDAVASKITGSLSGAGTSNTVVSIAKNGSAWHTITFGSGVEDVEVQIMEHLLKDDYLTATVTTIGTGSPSNLAVQVTIADEADSPTN